VKLSAIFRKAADEQLRCGLPVHEPTAAPDEARRWWTVGCAVDAAAGTTPKPHRQAREFLRGLGCVNGPYFEPFQGFADGPTRQGARFDFLHLAALVAESEGL
jgi:hypothetical protein